MPNRSEISICGVPLTWDRRRPAGCDAARSRSSCSKQLVACACLLAGFAFTLTTPAAFCASDSSKLKPVYVLKQKGAVFGNQTVYVSPDCLRVDLTRLDCSVVLRPPGKKLRMLNLKKKMYYEKEIEKWHTDLIKPDPFEKNCARNGIKWRPVHSVDICGIATDEFILGRLRGATDQLNLSLPRDPMRRKIYLAKNIPISKAASTVLGRSCAVAWLDKLPMRVTTRKKKKDEMRTMLDTISCEKKMLPDSLFSVPPAFKKTENEFNVFIDFGDDADPMTGIEDILFKSVTGKDQPSK